MSSTRRNIILGLMLLGASGAVAGEQRATRVETARWAAGLNAKSAAGREWMNRNSPKIGRLVIPVLNRCLPETGDEITAFPVYVRLSRKGGVREVVTDLSESLGACMTAGTRDLRVPEPPRDDYWIQLNLAAGL